MKAANHFQAYSEKVASVLNRIDWEKAEVLANAILDAHLRGKKIFICGNGGSAANAMHLANDLLYGSGLNIDVEALSANTAMLTCLANDEGYDEIYARQIEAKGRLGDLLLVLSGSGNSPNVVKAIKIAKAKGLTTTAILGYSGGVCKGITDIAVHIDVDDMQIAEDFQMMIGHMITQWLAMSKHHIYAVGKLAIGETARPM